MDNLIQKSISHFIFPFLKNNELDEIRNKSTQLKGGICAYCGNGFNQMVSMNRLELARYTDWHLHKGRKSKHFCLPCITILRINDFRRKAVIVDQDGIQFLQMNHPQDRSILIQSIFYTPPKPPFAICLPSDYRKHFVLRTKLNYCPFQFHVQFGEESVSIAPSIHQTIFEAAEQLYTTGSSTNQIWLKTYRSNNDHRFEQFIAPWRPSSLLLLILKLAKPIEMDTTTDREDKDAYDVKN